MKEKGYEELRENCPVYRTLKVMGKRWSMDIVAELICNGASRRYNQLMKSLVFITPKVLSQRLKELEASGIIERIVYPDETPVRVEYRLTEKGADFKDIIRDMIKWGNKWTYDEPHEDNCKLCKDWRREHGIK